MILLTQTSKLLAVALANLLEVAVHDDEGSANAWMQFDSAAAAAGDVLAEAAQTAETTLELALRLAGCLRELVNVAAPLKGSEDKFRQVWAEARAALSEFDRMPLNLHAHYETAIVRDEEEFDVIALTSNDEETYKKTSSPGDMWAFVSATCPAGVELAQRLARLSRQPIYGNGEQVGSALRASKALIEALLAGEKRSEGDLRDTLANFDGLALG